MFVPKLLHVPFHRAYEAEIIPVKKPLIFHKPSTLLRPQRFTLILTSNFPRKAKIDLMYYLINKTSFLMTINYLPHSKEKVKR